MGRIVLHHLISNLSSNGAELMLLRLLSRIDRTLFSPVVTSLINHVPLAGRFRDIDIPVYTVGLHRGIPDPRGILRVAGLLKRTNTELVQTWMYHADLIGGMASKLVGGIPVAWNIRHSNLEPEVNHRSTLLAARACACVSGWLPAKIICCAEAARQSHVQFGYNPRRFEIIPNGFDLDTFVWQLEARREVRHELGIPGKTLTIGLVARFHPQKDHQNFIRAASRFAALYQDVCFLLAGDEVHWANPTLANWIGQAGVADKVRLLGRRADIPRLLAAFDIATSASQGEGFPNAVGEAMACQIPCVVTDVGDSATLVGDTGIVVPARNPEALAEAWMEVARLGETGRQLLGERARNRIQEMFSLDAVVNNYERVYADLFAAAAST